MDLLALLWCALAAVLTLLQTSKYPIGMTHDTAAYFSAAESLARGEGFLRLGDVLYRIFAPFYPIVLAPSVWLPLSMEDWARLINVIAHTATVLLVYFVVLRTTRNRWMGSFAALFAAVGYPMLSVTRFAWTEPLYIALSMVAIVGIAEAVMLAAAKGTDESFDSAQTAKPEPFRSAATWIWIASIAAGLGAATRYQGVVLFLPLGAAMLFAWRRKLLSIPAGLAGVVLASLPLGIWFIRNLAHTGELTGHASGDRPLMVSLKYTVFTLAEWMQPFPAIWIVAIMAAILVGLRARPLPPPSRYLILLLILYVVAHLVFLVYAASYRDVTRPDVRFLSPVFPPLVVVAALWLDRLPRQALVFTVSLFFIAAHAIPSLELLRETMAEGPGGLAVDKWKQSPTVLRMRELQESGAHVYCNYERAAFLLAGVPYDDRSDLLPPQEWIEQIAPTIPPDRELYMVWLLPYRGGKEPEQEPFEIDATIVVDEPGFGRIYRLR